MSKHGPGHVGEVTTELCNKCADNKAPATNIITIIIIHIIITNLIIINNIIHTTIISLIIITINKIIITSEIDYPFLTCIVTAVWTRIEMCRDFFVKTSLTFVPPNNSSN